MKQMALAWIVALSLHTAPADSAPGLDLPVELAEDSWRPLLECVDRDLQRRLEACLVENPLWAKLARQAKLAVGIVDLARIESPRFAQVNGNTMMYAASLPKIAVLLAAHQAFADGELEETLEIRQDLHEMIRVSSNESATRLIDTLGYERIASVLADPRYRLFDPEQGGGLWVGKRYAKAGDSTPDPLRGLSHAATATQVCRFYHLLATGRLVSPEHCRAMLAALSEPGLHTKFVRALDNRAPGARLYRKSGTWGNHHSDSVLVWGDPPRRYIAVAMVEHARGETILEQLIPALESALHQR